MARHRIHVLLCGSCNPQYDTIRFLTKLSRELPDAEFCYTGDDCVGSMVINGCESSCRKASDAIVILDGYHVNGLEVRPEDLLPTVVNILRPYMK